MARVPFRVSRTAPARLTLAVGSLVLLLGLAGWAVVHPTAPPAPPVAPVGATVDTTRPDALATPEVASFDTIAQVPPEPTPRTGMVTYQVQPGDVLWRIGEQFHLRPETLLWTNDIQDPDLLRVGQTLRIPPTDGLSYTLQPGDSLARIASRYGVDLSAIVGANGLADVDALQAGADLFLPGARPIRAAQAVADTVQAPSEASNQETAAVGVGVALPPNLDELLAAGWLRTQAASTLYKAAERGAPALHPLPPGARLERVGEFTSGRIQVRDPGDGTTRQAMTGWVDAVDLGVGKALTPRELPRGYPDNTRMDLPQVFAPYRSQFDGSPYADANCGPTTVGMALEAFGVQVSSGQLRAEALAAQGMRGNSVGTLITVLASVVEQHGLTTFGLRAADGAIQQWSTEDVRAHVQQGHPVIVQARYRNLPGRSGAAFAQDHYVLVTGLASSGFLYNDSVDADGLGWDRVMTPEQLERAMDASDRRYAHTAFAVGRSRCGPRPAERLSGGTHGCSRGRDTVSLPAVRWRWLLWGEEVHTGGVR